jgi:aromatic ring-opening dioxygenase catalytic subunit (LigB family)
MREVLLEAIQRIEYNILSVHHAVLHLLLQLKLFEGAGLKFGLSFVNLLKDRMEILQDQNQEILCQLTQLYPYMTKNARISHYLHLVLLQSGSTSRLTHNLQ